LVGKFRRERVRGSKVYVANFLSNNASVIDE
jgi:DNA-binding beta-propeller fold protein YncE